MQFIPVPNTASVEAIFDVFGQKVENVYHVSQSSPFTETALAQAASAFVDWYGLHGKTLTGGYCSLAKIVAKDLTSADGPAIEYNTGLPIAGTAPAAQAAPLNVTCAVSFGTAKRGRSYRGRIYQIGLNVSQYNENQITGGMQSALITAYAALVAAFHTAGFDMCVVSRFANKAPRAQGVHTTITSVNVDVNLDSQRRRLTGRGQ